MTDTTTLQGENRRYKREFGRIHQLLNEHGIEGPKRQRIVHAVEELLRSTDDVRERAATLCEEFADGTSPKIIAGHIRAMPLVKP